MYIFDTNAFLHLFKNYYKENFPSLWVKFNNMIDKGIIVSVMEVKRELEKNNDAVAMWVKNNSKIFLKPNQFEIDVIRHIYKNLNFEHNIAIKCRLRYCGQADPFLVAKAKNLGGKVVTMEKYKHDGAKIPNLCEYEGVECISLEDFMKEQGWIF